MTPTLTARRCLKEVMVDSKVGVMLALCKRRLSSFDDNPRNRQKGSS